MSAFSSTQYLSMTETDTAGMIRALEDEWSPIFDKANGKFLTDVKKEDLICPACSENFDEPRIMPCLHTFCTKCIQEFQSFNKNRPKVSIASMDMSLCGWKRKGSSVSFSSMPDLTMTSTVASSATDTRRTVLCPICDTEVDIPWDVSQLPHNFIISKLKLATLISNRGAGSFCDSCTIDQSNNGATARCLTCDENLCYLCVLAHCRQKRTSTHQLVEFNDPKFVEKIYQANFQTRCSKHEDNNVEMYCAQCEKVICRQCTVTHSGHICQSIQNTSLEHRETLRVLINKVTPKLKEIDTAIFSITDNEDSLRFRAKQVEKDINSYLDNYTKALQKHRRQLIRDLHIVLNEKEQRLHFQRVSLEQLKDNINNSCQLVSSSIKYSNHAELMSATHVLEDRLVYLRNLHISDKAGVDSFISFLPEKEAEVINNFQMYGCVTGQRPSPEKSFIKGEGLSTARVDRKSLVVLTVTDGDGTPMRNITDKIDAWLTCITTGDRKLEVTCEEIRDGTLSLSFIPSREGAHQLHVRVTGEDIQGSPFTFHVKSKWRKHSGLWHCCTFCSSGGKKDVRCACGGTMPGGYLGCGHGHPNHPGGHHWSCCGKLTEKSECFRTSRPSPVRQITV